MRQLISTLFLLLSLLAVPAWAETVNQEIAEAIQLNEQAAAFIQQGKYQEAEPLYKRSLAIREKALGPDHPDVADSLREVVPGKYVGIAFIEQDVRGDWSERLIRVRAADPN